MNWLLRISGLIDQLNEWVAKGVKWLILIVVFISALNATSRKFFDMSSNSWLEIQWYLFGAIFLLAGGFAFLKNEHVRVDIFYLSLSEKKQILIEIFGVIFFLLPACGLVLYFSIPFFYESYVTGEVSSNSGGLIRWPAKILIPVGFILLILAGISHIIKSIGFLKGLCGNPTKRRQVKSAEEELAEEIAMQAEIKMNRKVD